MDAGGAGEGNRTLVVSLGSFCSAIELHPRSARNDRRTPRRCKRLGWTSARSRRFADPLASRFGVSSDRRRFSIGAAIMRQRVLGTLTIGQAPRPDVVPIIDRHVSAEVRRIHRGVLDGLSHAEIAARYRPEGGEPELVTRLQDGTEIVLSRRRMKDGVQQALSALEAEGCDAILLLCTGTFDGLACDKAWLVEPDHIIPGMVAGLVEKRQLGIIVPIAGQIESEAGKWRGLARPPVFATASPYTSPPEAVGDAGATL